MRWLNHYQLDKIGNVVIFVLIMIVVLGGLGYVMLLGMNFASDGIPFLRHKSSPPQNYYFSSFALSPDGKTAVVSAGDEHGRHLFAFDLKTQVITPLTHAPGFQVYPAFAPDGKTRVYSQADSLTAPCHLWLCDADGTHARTLTHGPDTIDEFPAFAPDGMQVVYSHYRISKDGRDAYAVHVADGHVTRLTMLQQNLVVRPCVAPDSKTILFEKFTDTASGSYDTNLASVDMTGAGEATNLAQFGKNCFGAAFFPDRNRVVFTVNDGGGGGSLWTLDLDASGAQPVLLHRDDDYSGDTNAAVSGDGKWVIFLRHGGLWRVSSRGGDAVQIAPPTLFNTIPYI